MRERVKLGAIWHQLAETFRKKGYVSTSEAAEVLKVSKSWTLKLLKQLKDIGLIDYGPTPFREANPGVKGDMFWSIPEPKEAAESLGREEIIFPKQNLSLRSASTMSAKQAKKMKDAYRRMADRQNFASKTKKGREITNRWNQIVRRHDEICGKIHLRKAA